MDVSQWLTKTYTSFPLPENGVIFLGAFFNSELDIVGMAAVRQQSGRGWLDVLHDGHTFFNVVVLVTTAAIAVARLITRICCWWWDCSHICVNCNPQLKQSQ